MRSLTLLLTSALLFACEKDDGECPPDDLPSSGNASCGTVAGITRCDVNGHVIADDPDDWNWTDEWCPAEEVQFQDRPTVIWSTSPPDSLLIVCFPNPVEDEFRLAFVRDDISYVDIRFVDAEFQYLWGIDSLTSQQCEIQTDSLGITGDAMVRVLYRVVHADGTAHRGHGDVQVEQ